MFLTIASARLPCCTTLSRFRSDHRPHISGSLNDGRASDAMGGLEQSSLVLGRYHVPGALLAAAPFFVTRLETPGTLQRVARTAWRTAAVEGIGHSGALSNRCLAATKCGLVFLGRLQHHCFVDITDKHYF